MPCAYFPLASFSSVDDIAELPPAFEEESPESRGPHVKRPPQKVPTLSPLIKLQSILYDHSVKDCLEVGKAIYESIHDTLAQGGYAETVETDTILLTILPGLNRY